jgi:hypothetical protein
MEQPIREAAPPGGRGRSLTTWAAAISVVLLARLLPVLVFGPDAPPPSGDLMVYAKVGQDLARSSDAWLKRGGEFGYRAPLFFAYLAGVYRLIPTDSYKVAQVAALLLGVVACLLAYRVGLSAGGPRTAWAAFWIRGLLPPFIALDTFPITESLFSVLLLGSVATVLALREPGRAGEASPAGRRLLGLSVLLGILAAAIVLTRDSAIGYPLLLAAALYLLVRRSGQPLRPLLHYGSTFLLLLLPWLARNQIVWGSPLPLANTSGVNLHIGNHLDATGKHVDLHLRPPEGVPWGSPAFNRWHRDQALAFIRENPGTFIQNGFRKVSWLLFPSFHRDFLRTAYEPPELPLLALSLLSGMTSALLLLAGMAGLILRRASALSWITLVVIVYLACGTFLAHGHPRYRDPIDQLLVVHAAALLTALRGDPAERAGALLPSRRRMVYLGAVIVFVVLSWAWVGWVKSAG